MAHYTWKAGRDNLHGKQRLRTCALGSAPSRESRPSPLRAAARLRCRPQSGYRAIEGAVACRSDGRGQFVTLTPEELKALDVESSKVIVASCRSPSALPSGTSKENLRSPFVGNAGSHSSIPAALAFPGGTGISPLPPPKVSLFQLGTARMGTSTGRYNQRLPP